MEDRQRFYCNIIPGKKRQPEGKIRLEKKRKISEKPLDISAWLCYYNHCSDAEHLIRGYSSAGRALEWHSRGQRFDPAYLHQEREKPWNFGFQGFSRDPSISYGPVAQLGERSVRIREVESSNLFRSTKRKSTPKACFSFWWWDLRQPPAAYSAFS